MAALFRFVKYLGNNVQLSRQNRNISLSATRNIKEIIEKKEGNTLTIEGVIKPYEKEALLVKTNNGACSICSHGLDVKHTDVLILSQFLRSDGCILPRRITGLCKVQQKRISIMILMAQRAGLIPSRSPTNTKFDPLRRKKWRKFNTYYDESTIKAKYI